MRLDSHVHTVYGDTQVSVLKANMAKAGIDGMVLLSQSPGMFPGEKQYPPEQRLQDVLDIAKGEDCFYPFFFIDPTDADALDQVDRAVESGIRGFKIICNHFYPYDDRCVPVYQRIAMHGKPILFHSGILYDGKNASGNFGRPCNFEILLSIENLRFALAHVSWPWTDECIAVYGKFNNCLKSGGETAASMFIDLTPGTPPIYRKGVLERLLLTGYDVENNIIWGTDNWTNNYSVDYAMEIYNRDIGILDELPVSEEIKNKIFSQNLLRFINGDRQPQKGV